jgi:alpha/beta superfamily hydrolase
MNAEHHITIQSDGLQLEGELRDGEGALAALVLHPHPQHGGDMSNHVVMAVCQALAEFGAATLRFNYRGAGRSEGTYDGGRGEAEDARAAAAILRSSNTGAKLVLAGYSFGAMIAANIAADIRPDALILVSPPTGMVELPSFDGSLPMLVAAGDRDQVAPASAIRALEAPNRSIVIAPGVDHSWWPGLDDLQDAVRSFVEANMVAASRR